MEYVLKEMNKLITELDIYLMVLLILSIIFFFFSCSATSYYYKRRRSVTCIYVYFVFGVSVLNSRFMF